MYIAEPGDILLYRKLRTLEVREIDFIERLRNGPQVYFYYHSAIAIDDKHIIESNGKRVVLKEVSEDDFDVFRPPIPLNARMNGIAYIRNLIGQRYDWVLIVDDVLRTFTHNLMHLPVRFVDREERH